MAGRKLCTALLLLGCLVALGSAEEQVDSIVDSISAFIETIDDGTTTNGRDLKNKCTHCGVSTARPPPPPAYPPPPSPCPPPPSPPPPSPVCYTCKKASPPPPVKVYAPPPKVVLCPPPPVRVSSPPYCWKCHAHSPPPVKVYSPPVAVKAPPPAPKKELCGYTLTWVRKPRKWGKSRWVKTWVKYYCPVGQKCCKIPAAWGKKSSGKKYRSRGTKTQLRCYKTCPKCWY